MTIKKYHIIIFFVLTLPLLGYTQDDSDINPIRLNDSTVVIDLLNEAKRTYNHVAKIKNVESALEIAKKINYENGILQCLSILNEEYQKGDNSLKALSYALEQLHKVKNKGDLNKQYRMSFLIAQIYLDYGSSNKAIEYFKQAEKFLSSQNSQKEKAIFYESFADAYSANNQNIESNRYYNYAIEILEKYEEEQRILQKITDDYIKTNKHEQAILTLTYIKDLALKKGKKTDAAIAANNIASLYHLQKKYTQAIPYFEEALKDEKLIPQQTLSTLFANYGIALQNTGNLNGAIFNLNKALTIAKTIKKNNEIASIENLLANIYLAQKDYYNAQKLINSAEKTAIANTYVDTKSSIYYTAALLYQQLYEYEKAFDYYQKYLNLKDEILVAEKTAQQDLQRQIFLLEKQEKELQLTFINKDIQDLSLKQLKLESEKLKLEAARKEDELKLLKQSEEANAIALKNKELEAIKVQQDLELVKQNLATSEKDKRLRELKQKEALQIVELARQKAETQQNLQAISLLQKDKELLTANNELLSKDAALKELELASQRNFQRLAYGIGLLLLVITGLIIRGLYLARKNNKLLQQKNKEIESSRLETEIERHKAEELLLNILPHETADELKQNGIATPRHYAKVSVLFTDFSNFTQISAKLTPEELITELNECFSAFDDIVVRFGLEKIKTIGDAYMCAGGIPTANDSNPRDAVAAALELQHFMKKRNEERNKKGLPHFQMRVGIHTGEVITGVVGKNKFAYDIWGDTVNLASRMESTCPPNAVNISEATYQYVKNDFSCIPRGEIEAKGKGKVMMYLVS